MKNSARDFYYYRPNFAETITTFPDGTAGETYNVPFIRQSERKSFKTCQYQWDWAWNAGFTPAMEKQDARWFGTGIHLALAEWYIPGKKRGRDLNETWEEFCGENYATISIGDYFDKTEYVNAKELGHEMLVNYKKEFGTDSNFEIVSVEQRYRKLLREPGAELHDVMGVLVGTFDAVVRELDTGKLWMIDHKTAKNTITTNHLVKDEQAGTYVSVGTEVLRLQGLIGQDEIIEGIIYNFLRKAKADERPRNAEGLYCNKPTKDHYIQAILDHAHGIGKPNIFTKSELTKLKVDQLAATANTLDLTVCGEASKLQPVPLFKREYVTRNRYENVRQIERIMNEVQQMQAIRSGKLPITKAPGEHCAWCDFRDLCDVDEQGGDAEAFAKAAFKRRDPYADHREDAENSKTSVKNNTELTKGTGIKKTRKF